MEWIYLTLAGFFEFGWAIGLKYSQGFTKLWPSLLTVCAMIASFFFLSFSLKNLPLGTAYAVWTGIGTVGTVLLGAAVFKEPLDSIRLICIAFIIIGIIGLKLVSTH